MLNNIDYKVPRTEDSILINIDEWKTGDGNLIKKQKISGKVSPTYITEVKKINKSSKFWENFPVFEQDVVLVSRIASDVAPFRSFELLEEGKYFNVPFSQIMGYFSGNEITIEKLIMVEDKMLVKKIEKTGESFLDIKNPNVMIGEVIKTGTCSLGDNGETRLPKKVHTGNKILIRDNISTEINLNNEKYYALEERMVVGIFHDGFSLENLELINGSILLIPYTPSTVLNSKLLITPQINYEDLDYSSIYNRDLFQIKYLDKSIKSLEIGDQVLVSRDYTNYVYYGMEKYFIINGKKDIMGKIKERVND